MSKGSDTEQFIAQDTLPGLAKPEPIPHNRLLRLPGLRQATAFIVAGALMPAVAYSTAKSDTNSINPEGAPIPTMVANQLPTDICGQEVSGGEPKTSLKVVGTHVEDSQGHLIMPYGISVVQGDYTNLKVEAQANAQIEAASGSWGVNAVRLQVSEDEMFAHPTSGNAFNDTYASAVNGLVCKVIKLHKIVILNDNNEFTGNQPNPTGLTVKFWELMSERYGNKFPVMFDLFNEPRLKHLEGSTSMMDANTIWRLWQWGGTVSGVNYVGMQTLTDDIRNKGITNVIEQEGPYETSRMQLLPSHLIKDQNSVYGVHKENLHDESVWYTQIGKLVKQGIPIEDGEWSLFASPHRPWECYSNGYTAAPKYLAYLQRLGVPLVAWALRPGALASAPGHLPNRETSSYEIPTNAADLNAPTEMTPSFGCNEKSLGQGAGALIKAYFHKYSKKLPDALFPTFVKGSQ
ncbi:MAG TPA: cellulase family glycosylhydrolase [Candidatus Saccharimonadales bacterium]|jgi:hypothetical protein|nr:cellulase family glycosylhydrolase [Candidatus Saccharimonadales bacterium]